MVGAGARGCCYEVGEEVLERFEDVPGARVGERNLDLEAVAAAKLAEAGVAEVHDVGLCTMCRRDLFFSHRADGGITGRQAGVVWRSLIRGLDAGRVRENAERIRAEIGGAELLAAVKYVALEELDVLAEAGVTLLGENRAQDLVAKAEAHPGTFRWHFIGQLQSRKVKDVLPYVELIHSVASDSALRRLGQHGTPETRVLVEVDVAGEEAKAGIAPAELGEFIARCPVTVAGLMTMPPYAEDPEASRPLFRGPARARPRARAAPSLHGHLPGLPRRRGGGRDHRAGRLAPLRLLDCVVAGNSREHPEPTRDMGFSDTWHRTLVYFGLAEDHDAYDDVEEPDPRDSEAELESRYRERPNVRRLQSRRRRDEIDDIFADDSPSERRTSVLRSVGSGGGTATAPRQANGRDVRVHLVIPKSFNDAQDVADKFKDAIPVILNLQSPTPTSPSA